MTDPENLRNAKRIVIDQLLGMRDSFGLRIHTADSAKTFMGAIELMIEIKLANREREILDAIKPLLEPSDE